MSRIFDVDNGFFRFMTRVADALILNLIFPIQRCIIIVSRLSTMRRDISGRAIGSPLRPILYRDFFLK